MAKAPLVGDNWMLRGIIWVIEDKSADAPTDTPTADFLRRQLNLRPEFNIWCEHDQLRESAKLVLYADEHYAKALRGRGRFATWFKFENKQIKALKVKRDELYDDYEMLRRLIALDNLSIVPCKTKA